MTKRRSDAEDELATLDDDYDEELMAICEAFTSKRHSSAEAGKSKSTTTGGQSGQAKRPSTLNSQIREYRAKQQEAFKSGPSSSATLKQPPTATTAADDDVAYLLDDSDDEDLLQLSLSFTSPSSHLKRADQKATSTGGLVASTSGKSAPSKTSSQLSDLDDEELMEAISRSLAKSAPSSSTHHKALGSTAPGRGDQMSEADRKAIAEALDELERSYSSQHIDDDTLQLMELIDIADILEDSQLESYNKNASTIRQLSIVHPDLEQLDPNPDIHQLFRQFDVDYFDGFLTSQALKLGWANNFYSVAGAFYGQKEGLPTILLSANLLTLRPRRDLVETLLHEMIHAYIHLQQLVDTSDHGQIFQFHMRRINRVAGTSITVFHSFLEEVSYLRKYIWRCNGGKCRAVLPYRGFISLPTKRKPSRWDKAFRVHQQIGCSGIFEQVSNNFAATKRPAAKKSKK